MKNQYDEIKKLLSAETKMELKFLCKRLGLTQNQIFDRIFAYRNVSDPKTAAEYTFDYLGSIMSNQTIEEQDKTMLYLISLCSYTIIGE